jgi:hypothetical protein
MMLDTLMNSEGPYKVAFLYQISKTKQTIVARIPENRAVRKAFPNGTSFNLVRIKNDLCSE